MVFIIDIPSSGTLYSADGVEIKFSKVGTDKKFAGKYKDKDDKSYPERGTYSQGNSLSPVSVVIPMPDKKAIQSAIEAGAAMAGSVVTANIGVEKIVLNTISNPNIRYIVLFGKDSAGHFSGDAIYNLHANGVDEKRKVIGSKGLTPYLKNIPIEAINRFREQIISVINVMGIDDLSVLEKVIHFTIQEPENAIKIDIVCDGAIESFVLFDPGKFDKAPLNISITDTIASNGLYEALTHYSSSIIAPSIATAYPLLVDAVMSAGLEQNLPDERLAYTRELLNVIVHIERPLEDMVPLGYKPEAWLKDSKEVQQYLGKYANTYFSDDLAVGLENGKISNVTKKKGKDGMEYTYGYFIQKHYEVQQILKVANEVADSIKNKEPSRRILISLPDPKIFKKVSEVPCFIDYQLFPRYNSYEDFWELHATAHMRSHDVKNAFPANAYAFATILDKISSITGTRPGSLTMFLGSAHVYLNR
ncbi:MAG: thymidylate synthase [DPANN group archaeon]|nr:thymidylate synthase [DPANN group archaeon]